MVEVAYSNHLKLRLTLRKIPETYPAEIYHHPEQRFFDVVEGTQIAVRRLLYSNKVRPMMIAYEWEEGKAKIVTIHPMAEDKIINRILSGRWIPP